MTVEQLSAPDRTPECAPTSTPRRGADKPAPGRLRHRIAAGKRPGAGQGRIHGLDGLRALAVVVVCTLAAAALGGDVLHHLGWQLLGIFTFMANWVQMATSFDYFNASNAGLFDNFWSLGIEEQFYFVWPVVLIAVLARGALFPRSTLARLRAHLLLWAVLSAALMLVLVQFGQANVAYLATFSHLYGILLGAALAMSPAVLTRSWPPVAPGAAGAVSGHASGSALVRAHDDGAAEPGTGPFAGMLRSASRAGLALLLLATGAAAVLWLAFSGVGETPGREPLLTLAASVAGLLLVAGCLTANGGARFLDRGLLGWIGTRSYGLYLWHFPLIVLADHVVAGPGRSIPLFNLLDSTQTRVLAVVLAVMAAELSYRYVEAPVRRHGFAHLTRVPTRALAAGLAVAVLVSAVVWSQARAPQQTELEAALAEQQAYTESFGDEPTPAAESAEEPAPDDGAGMLPTEGADSAADQSSERVFPEDPVPSPWVPRRQTTDPEAEAPQGEARSAPQTEAAEEAPPIPDEPEATEGAPSQAPESAPGAESQHEPERESEPGPQTDPGPEPGTGPTADVESSPAPEQIEQRQIEQRSASASMVAVGDSVMLASSGAMSSRFDVVVDAAESRQLVHTPEVVAQAVAQVPGAQTVVIGVGINGVGGESEMRQAVQNAGDRTVVLVNLSGPMPFIDSHNAMLQAVTASHGNVVVADWNSRAESNTGCLQADQVHPVGECTELYAEAIAAALTP